MEKRIVFLTIFCLILAGCQQSAPEPTAATTQPPVETTVPLQTAAHTAPNTESTPPETLPPETILPPETTVPPTATSYTIQVADPEKLIYERPGFRFRCTASFGEAGIYTIVEEATDWDGNLWGRLKSGIGWVCLTEPAIVPVIADYTPEHFAPNHHFHCGETDYVTDIGVIPMEPISNVKFSQINVIDDYQVEQVLLELDTLAAQETVLLSVVYWGDMTTYGISFTDADGHDRYYSLSVSGKDGSLICSEYTP